MAVTISAYDQTIAVGLDGTIDYNTDTFKAELYNSSHTFDQTDTVRADISANALGSGSGYTSPGQALASLVLSQTGGVTKWDADDVTWTASGGSIGPARHCVLMCTTTDKLLFDINFGADQTAADGTDFKITFNASGIFTVT